MSMRQWLAKLPYNPDKPTRQPSAGNDRIVIVSDEIVVTNPRLYREAYHLSDYRVARVSAGTMYFVPIG